METGRRGLGPAGSGLRCSLVYVGLPNESYPITCNETLLYVHYNLYSALPYLARREGDEVALPM